MSELSGLELRKAACEALGWKRNERLPTWPNPGWRGPSGNLTCDLPAIESDPAVSESMFLEWCDKNRFDSALETCFDGRPSCRVFNRHTAPTVPIELVAMAFGDTPSEARARAIVAAQTKVG